MIRIVLGLLLSLVFCLNLEAQSLLAVDKLNGDFFSIDCRTGSYSQVSSSSSFLVLWSGLATDASSQVFAVGIPANQTTHSDLYKVDSLTGQVTFLSTINRTGINAFAFGPNDVLFAAIDSNYSSSPPDYELFSIDLASGSTTFIGSMGLNGVVQTMDFDGTDMYVWDSQKGLHHLDLNTGQTSDVKLRFTGNTDLSESMCFSDNGTLYLLDYGLWITEPTTGVSNFVDFTYPGILGGVEYIPGPNQVMSFWQTERVGNSTEIKIRGATPGAQVAIFMSDDRSGSITIPFGFPCAGTIIDLHPGFLRVARVATADANGEILLGPSVLPPQAKGHLRMQAIDLSTCVTSNRIETVF
ncbi:MAG: hypothetical protein COA70_09975 [Planctomycetota bacterium]|nr:MAG: hypothetical protein COA70_09975 [Planctomycetota bacterium]